jgi:Xaa-Pro aminopeptidase
MQTTYSDDTLVSGIPRAEFASRRAELRARIADRGLIGVIVVSRGGHTGEAGADVLYLTNHYSGFPGVQGTKPPRWSGRSFAAFVMPVDEDGTLVSDIPDWRDDLVAIDDVRVDINLWRGLVEALGARGLTSGRIGVIGRDNFPHGAARQVLDAYPGLEFVACEDEIEQMMLVKSPHEIELLRASAKVGVALANAFTAAVEPGVTEADCVVAGLAAALPLGANHMDIYVTSGPRSDHFCWSRLPSYDAKRPLEHGDLIHADIYGTVDGYQYDLVRSAIAGNDPNDGQREVLEGAIAVIHHMIDGMLPGVACSEIYERGSSWLIEHGFAEPRAHAANEATSQAMLGETFPPFGHTIGLTTQSPYLLPETTDVLGPNMVFAVEIAVGLPGVGTAGFEQDVLITADGPEILTTEAVARPWE